jgi:Tfp pilus assembly protein PilF
MMHSNDINALLRQAQASLQSGRFAEAEQMLATARQRMPGQAPILFLSSRAARGLGRTGQAAAFLKEATTASPRDA